MANINIIVNTPDKVASEEFTPDATIKTGSCSGNVARLPISIDLDALDIASIASNAVLTEGNQTIAGNKTFTGNTTLGLVGFYGNVPVTQQSYIAYVADDESVAYTATVVTDSTGGTSDGTLAAVAGSGADATINDNFADLAAVLNAKADLTDVNALRTAVENLRATLEDMRTKNVATTLVTAA